MPAADLPVPNRLSVLLVDDSRPVRAVVRTLLTGLGFGAVYEAADSDEALVLARTCGPDFALIDYDLGMSSGLDLARRFRDPVQSLRPDLPLILLAADGFAHLVRGAASAGISAVLPKPVNPARLREALLGISHAESIAQPASRARF
ncbi:response regulator [Maricaulis sp.]|uniref:response regulator n=1 Tax=Maricaulis sp. TaxID=1486257 RepID=UPI0025E9C32F|nr:response regulator [Maricaulis sp.]MDF1768150.1 response regulator [Maricaulis sp.]